MTRSRLAASSALAVCAFLLSTAAQSAPVLARVTSRSPFRPLAQSPELWATIDVCNTPRHPNTIGVRGSMPTDGHPHDMMFMRFLVQSLDPSTSRWSDLGKGADSGFLPVGSAAYNRQAGRTFEFKPSQAAYTLRGYVEFQWRHSRRVVHFASRATAASHTSLAGAEPKGFSAATCTLK